MAGAGSLRSRLIGVEKRLSSHYGELAETELAAMPDDEIAKLLFDLHVTTSLENLREQLREEDDRYRQPRGTFELMVGDAPADVVHQIAALLDDRTLDAYADAQRLLRSGAWEPVPFQALFLARWIARRRRSACERDS